MIAAHLVPSVVALGQWTPLRALPRGWCRWRGPTVPAVALTFDDGPDPVHTPRVLDRLDELGMRATFFVLGSRVLEAPEVVAETLRRGHQVETHGHEHAHHFARSPRWVVDDLDRSLGALADCGVTARWFRPPFGQAAGATIVAARRRRLELVLWSSWGREWAAPDAESVAERVDAGLEPGAIVLLHDSDDLSPAGTVDRVLGALGHIAEGLVRRGLETRTLEDLVGAAP